MVIIESPFKLALMTLGSMPLMLVYDESELNSVDATYVDSRFNIVKARYDDLVQCR